MESSRPCAQVTELDRLAIDTDRYNLIRNRLNLTSTAPV
jgi:hypothetical protein